MSWPAGPWTVRTGGICGVTGTDSLLIVPRGGNEDIDIVVSFDASGKPDVTRPWGKKLVYSGSTAKIDAGGPHTVTYTAADTTAKPPTKAKLVCTYDRRDFPREAGEDSHEHTHHQHDDDHGHTGGTGLSWTAEDGG